MIIQFFEQHKLPRSADTLKDELKRTQLCDVTNINLSRAITATIRKEMGRHGNGKENNPSDEAVLEGLMAKIISNEANLTPADKSKEQIAKLLHLPAFQKIVKTADELFFDSTP